MLNRRQLDDEGIRRFEHNRCQLSVYEALYASQAVSIQELPIPFFSPFLRNPLIPQKRQTRSDPTLARNSILYADSSISVGNRRLRCWGKLVAIWAARQSVTDAAQCSGSAKHAARFRCRLNSDEATGPV